MTIRTVLATVRGDGMGEGVLDHALVLGRPFNAHIEVVLCRARAEDMLPYSTVITASMRETILQSALGAAEEEASRVKDLFMEYLETHDVTLIDTPPAPGGLLSASWHEVEGRQSNVVAVRGRLADVIAVAQPVDGGLGHATLEAALLETGKLVLVCPPSPVTSIGEHPCFGWNGSAESARAVSAAMPLIENAKAVTVFTAPESMENKLTIKDLTEHLGWRDIEVKVRTLNVAATSVGQALLDESKAVGGDVLVIGGYGHSRRRELVMGGVTRHIIENTDLPVLMVH